MQITKMHGLGNDFIFYYPRSGDKKNEEKKYKEIAKEVCSRRLGAGADGLVLVLPSETCDIRMRIFNADGSEAEMCGNGIRCFAKYVYEKRIITKEEMTVETLAGVIKPKLIIEDDRVELVTVDMGTPIFEPKDIPVNLAKEALMQTQIKIEDQIFDIAVTNTGVPHAVVFVDEIDDEQIFKYGPMIEKHELFPKNTNVNFVKVIDENNIEVSTWERGAGKTMACGTGCCAAVVASVKRGMTKRKVSVKLFAGFLDIEYKQDEHVIMTGPATVVYEGVYFIEI